MEMIGTCFNKSVQSVIMQIPDKDESDKFKNCLRKFARTKMRIVDYYEQSLMVKNEENNL